MDTYVLFAVTIDGTVIDGITSQQVGHNIQKAINHNDGSPESRFAGVMSAKPTISFTTVALKKLLDVIGTQGAAISSSVVLFFQKTAANGKRAGSTSHLKLTIAAGLVVPRRLSVSQDGEAQLTAEIFPISSDGSTSPITYADSQSLAGSPDSAQKYTVGPVKINGTAWESQSIEVDFGIDVQTRSHSGYVYPVHAFINRIHPTIGFTTLDAGILATFGIPGAAQGSTDSVVYFRKLAEGSTRDADNSSTHVSLTIDEGLITVDGGQASDGGDATFSGMIDVTYDGSNAPLVLSTGAQIV